MNKFLKEFKDRGLYYQSTDDDGLSSYLDKNKIKAYIGLIVLLKVFMLVVYSK